MRGTKSCVALNWYASAQQLFTGEDQEDEGENGILPHGNTQQPDFGFNYYLKDGLKASASYGRNSARHPQLECLDLWDCLALCCAPGPRGRPMKMRNGIAHSGYRGSVLRRCGRPLRRKSDGPSPAASVTSNDDPDAMRVEGEKRYHANCGRCHAAPHKFPPRMMATIVRHMRVRAMITDEDMRLVLYYMTQ